MRERYDIKFPVKYDRKNYRIIDSDHKVRCRPWQLLGMSLDEVHELGEFIAKAMNFKNQKKDGKDKNG